MTNDIMTNELMKNELMTNDIMTNVTEPFYNPNEKAINCLRRFTTRNIIFIINIYL